MDLRLFHFPLEDVEHVLALIEGDLGAGHPLVNFLYFALVLVFAMFFTHPASQIISLLSALAYAAQLNGRHKTQRHGQHQR